MNALRIPLLAGLLLLAGCSLFGSKEEDAEPPTELAEFETTLKVKRAWDAKVGSGSERLRLGLIVATDGTNVFAASRKGKVMAFEADGGKRVCRSRHRRRVVGGGVQRRRSRAARLG
jgi:outer membrane protein assembly factor BamB